MRLVKSNEAIVPSYEDNARSHRVEALKALTRALLQEVEALSEASAMETPVEINLSDEVHRYEADLIRSALIRTGGRQRRAARLLNVKVATLNAKIKRYNLNMDELVMQTSDLRRRVK